MIKRIHMHWTAGADGVNQLEEDAYNFIVGRTGNVVEGTHPPESQTPENIKKGSRHYAAHTLNANSYAIGVAMDAMAGANEVPFRAGTAPITTVQVEAFCKFVATLCKKYGVVVSRSTVLTHAEVQRTLGIAQKQKWDITWLPGMAKPGDSIEVGDVLRAKIKAYMLEQDGVLVATPTKPSLGGVPTKGNQPAGFAALLAAVFALFKKGTK